MLMVVLGKLRLMQIAQLKYALNMNRICSKKVLFEHYIPCLFYALPNLSQIAPPWEVQFRYILMQICLKQHKKCIIFTTALQKIDTNKVPKCATTKMHKCTITMIQDYDGNNSLTIFFQITRLCSEDSLEWSLIQLFTLLCQSR